MKLLNQSIIFIKILYCQLFAFLVRNKLLRLNNKIWSSIHLFHHSNLYKINKKNKINKIAFVIHDSISYEHSINCIKRLPKDSFDIIFVNYKCAFIPKHLFNIINNAKTEQNFLSAKKEELNLLVNEKNCEIKYINQCFFHDYYSVVVCAHNGLECTARRYTTTSNYEYGIKFLGKHVVYFQFTIDVTFAATKHRNLNFNSIFYSGDWSAKLCKSSFDGNLPFDIFCVGSPRFENKLLLKHIDNENDQKVILWLPSHNKTTSCCETFLNAINSFAKSKYNVILKPHHWCYSENKHLEQMLSKYKNISVKRYDSIERLLPLADYVFCDYGGSVFSAIYYDKNVLFLNTKNKKYLLKPYPFGADSPEVKLREEIINFNEDEGDRIAEALSDDKIWEEQKQIRADIKKRFFTIGDEPASQRIANILLDILSKNKVS